jgi:hypothetical protein
MKPVRIQTNLVLRGKTYYFRKRIPVDLQDYYKLPANEINQSLHTKDAKEGARLALQRAAALEDEFAKVRKNQQPKQQTELTESLSKALAASMLSSTLEADDELRLDGIDPSLFTQLTRELKVDLQAARKAYATGDPSAVAMHLEEWLSHHNVVVDKESLLFRKLCREFLTARVKALEAMQQRNEG